MRTRNRVGLAAVVMIAVGGACGVVSGQEPTRSGVGPVVHATRASFGGIAAAIDRGERIEITPEVRARLDAIDAQANQKDALWSGLSWHTDLDAALAEGKRLNKPVLSLRMLGRLDEEYSCANSRFFRAALYANAEVSAYLRDHFVLHWESVRPVPRITIDYGDGRVIESTITGNSIHYVLSHEGDVVDALPGLYGPGVFLEALNNAFSAASGSHDASEVLASATQEITPFTAMSVNDGRFERVPAEMAQAAMRATFSKAFVEMPVLNAVLGLEAHPVDARVPLAAAGYIDRCRLDARSISLIRTQSGEADEATLSRVIASFEESMAADTALNEETVRPRILAMLAQEPSLRHDVAGLNERVYAEVFMTPSQDPWLGLRAADAFTGLWAQPDR